MTDLGTLGGKRSRSHALAINDAGQVVGWSETATGETHAFLWENGKMIDLGTLPGYAKSIASGINAKDQVVGYSEAPIQQAPFNAAFLWQDGTMQDLGAPPGATSTEA